MKNTKICTTCGNSKSVKDFAKQASMYDGYKSQCKACCKKRDRANRLAKMMKKAIEAVGSINSISYA